MINEPASLSNSQLVNILMLSPFPTAIYKGDDLMIEMANDAMLHLWGKDRSVAGKPLAEALPEATHEALIGTLKTLWRTGESYEATNGAAAHTAADGKPSAPSFSCRAIRNEDGSVFCLLHTAAGAGKDKEKTGETAAQETETGASAMTLPANTFAPNQYGHAMPGAAERAATSESRLAAIAANPDIYLLLTDDKGRVLFANEVLRRLTGWMMGDFTEGEYIDLIHFEDKEAFLKNVNPALASRHSYQYEVRIKGRDGNYHHARISGTPVFDHQQQVAGYVACGINISEKKRHEAQKHLLDEELRTMNEELQAINKELHANNEEARVKNEALNAAYKELLEMQADLQLSNLKLSESEEKLRLAIRSSNLGTWYIHLATREFVASPRAKELFGYPPNAPLTYEQALERVREDYREKVQQGKDEAIANNSEFKMDFPITGFADGRQRWVHSTGKVFQTDHEPVATFFGTLDDITERKEDEQRKNDFIGMVSHELKTPLTSLNGFLYIIKHIMDTSEHGFGSELTQKAKKQVEKMTTLINGFLNVSRYESGKIHIVNSVFDMAGLMKESEEEIRSLYTSHTLVFYPVETAMVNADREKIGQVVNNLVSNAVKYSSPGSTVTVSCDAGNGDVNVCVRDEGIGIPEEEIPRLFERYYRVNNKGTTSISGFGIGLYLCAEILNRQGGDIWVESERGKGSLFCFRLPLAG